jgi:gluconate 2-dehydrogenase subunit 3-like protein
MIDELSRRKFLSQAGRGISAAWVAAHWPQMVAAATHAHAAAQSATPPKFEFFTPEEAIEVEAISSRIIPSDDSPGAKEAGVVYFMDKALVTFGKDDQPKFRDGLRSLQQAVHEKFPEATKFSALHPDQQDQFLQSIQPDPKAPSRSRRFTPEAGSFFEAIRIGTISGFLIDPESDRRGNRDGLGWKLIGREPSHTFQPPFGYYDKDYPGYQIQPATPAASGEKK